MWGGGGGGLGCFFFNDTATTEIYTLSLHDALPIFRLSIAEKTHNEAFRVLQFLPGPRLGKIAIFH